MLSVLYRMEGELPKKKNNRIKGIDAVIRKVFLLKSVFIYNKTPVRNITATEK